MKKLLLVVLLLFSTNVYSQVSEQRTYNNMGEPVIRFYNASHRPVSCYYRDQGSYYTFVIYPQSFSMWYFVYGRYEWRCN